MLIIINSAKGSSLQLLLCQSCSITCVWFPVEVLTGLGLAPAYTWLCPPHTARPRQLSSIQGSLSIKHDFYAIHSLLQISDANIHAALQQPNRLWLVESSLLNPPRYTLHAIRINLI